MSVNLTAELWGGLIESLEACQENNELQENIKILKQKLKLLENSKCLRDIQHSIHFTENERNYLNSPLLDEIYSTIFSDNPLEKAVENKKEKAILFYAERGLEISIHVFQKFIYKRFTWDPREQDEKEVIKDLKHYYSLKINIINPEHAECCVRADHAEVLDFFLENGLVEVNSLLKTAATYDCIECLKLLLKKGHVTQEGKDNAVSLCVDRVEKILIENGAVCHPRWA